MFPIEGMQFHPESFATEGGKSMTHNFCLHHMKEYLKKFLEVRNLTREESGSSDGNNRHGTSGSEAETAAFLMGSGKTRNRSRNCRHG